MFKLKKKTKIEKDEFPYMGLLSNNAPQVSPDYFEDAAILNEQINNPKTFNVAVMAKYGAGKSSVINTYLNIYRSKEIKKKVSKNIQADKLNDTKNEDKENKNDNSIDYSIGDPIKNSYARVSLSTFNDTDFDEVAIERSILQQLLYSRKKSKLPNSKIERTNKTSWKKSLGFSMLITLFVLMVTLTSVEFALYTRDIKYAGVTSILCNNLPWLKYVFLATTFSLFFVIVVFILHYRKLRKIKYKDLEADLIHDGDKGTSVQISNLINKFIDEVLYFFECVNVDLVIFEDLDRLPTTEIFVKLRELNTIINNSNKCAKKVTFLYAVKDNLFKTDEERAKFFDFILPVVPIINPVTTVSEIEKRLKKLVAKNPQMQLSSKLIKGISLYIPDMRVLKNTFNDYIIMFHKIFEDKNSNQHLSADKLFAICVYKNLFPYDYTLLENKEGLIPEVINIRTLHLRLTKSIEEEIIKTEREIKKLQSERLKSFDELRTMLNGQLYQYSYVSRSVQPINILEIDTFSNLDFSHIMHPSRPSYCIDYDKEILTPNGERYVDREERIKEIEKAGIKKLQNKLSKLEKQKQQITFWSLKEIIEEKGVDFCFDENINNEFFFVDNKTLSPDEEEFLKLIKVKFGSVIDEKEFDKLKKDYVKFKSDKKDAHGELQVNYLRFLLKNDFIDEHYIKYTSNYKAEKLSQSDTKIVQSIQSDHLDFNVHVENLEEVIKWLDEDDFKNVAILIKPILSNINEVYKLSCSQTDNKYNNLMKLLSNVDKPVVLDTVLEFLCSATLEECDSLLKGLIPLRLTLCEEVLDSNKLDLSKQDFVIAEHIKYSVDNTVENKIIANIIEEKSNYMEIFNAVNDDEKVIKFIKEQSMIFINLNATQLDSTIQQYIIKNNLYELSVENLGIVLFGKVDSFNSDFYTKNYYTVRNSGKKHVIDYVDNNIETYIEEVLLDERITCENEPADLIEDLLKVDSVPVEYRKELIKKVKVEFKDISIFETELFKTLFDYNLVEPNWKNMQFAFEQTGFDTVNEFLKKTSTIHGNYDSLDGIKSDTSLNLINEILIHFTKEEVSKIVKTIPTEAKLSDIKVAEIGDDNLAEFIGATLIQHENTNLSHLIELPKSLNSYLKIYKDKIIGEFDTFFNDALPIIKQQNQSYYEYGRYVQKIIVNYTEKTNAQKIIAAVLACQEADNSIKNMLIEKCIEIIKITGYERIYSDYIINKKQSVPAKILWQFTNVNMTFEDKLEILIICNYGGTKAEPKDIKAYLISMGEPFTTLFNKQQKAKINKSAKISKFLYKLKEKSIINDYIKVRNKEEYWVS